MSPADTFADAASDAPVFPRADAANGDADSAADRVVAGTAPAPAPRAPAHRPVAPPPVAGVSAQSIRRAIGDRPPVLALQRLVAQGLDQLPLPGSGRTLDRWRALAAAGAADLSLAKLYEGHTDALAILSELSPGLPRPPGSLWGVWAAEAQGLSLDLVEVPDRPPLCNGQIGTLRGVKPWCSAAAAVTHALVTAHVGGGQRQLFAVKLGAGGVRVDASRWQAVGMAASASADVHFDGVVATVVGAPGAYLNRPGFAQGGAGVAACWFGAARELGRVLRQAPRAASPEAQALRAVALGRVSLSLAHSASLLARTAAAIDAAPTADVGDTARLLRLSVDRTAWQVLDEVLRALGPTPFCRDGALARLAADLPVFLRQCHSDGDLLLAGRAAQAAGLEHEPWRL